MILGMVLTLPHTHTHTHTHMHTHHTHAHTHTYTRTHPRVNPITWAGQEVLLLPVSTDEENSLIFQGLFHEDREEPPESSVL